MFENKNKNSNDNSNSQTIQDKETDCNGFDDYFNRVSFETTKEEAEKVVEKRLTEADKGDITIEKEFQEEVDKKDGKLLIDIIEEEEDSKKPHLLIFYYFINILDDGHGHSSHRSDEKGNSTVFQAATNIANTIMGAGILGIPLVYKAYGLILTTFIIIGFGMVTIYSVHCLLYSNKITGKSGYSIFSKICFGNKGSLLVKIVIIVNNFGLSCAYFRIFGDVASGVVKAFTTSTDNFFADNWHNWLYIILVGVLMSVFIFKDKIDALKVKETKCILLYIFINLIYFPYIKQK